MKIIMENAFKLFRRKTIKESGREHRTLGGKIFGCVWMK